MPIPNYSVLKGDPQRGEVAFNRQGKNPHYRIYMQDGSQVDVNIESSNGSEVLYVIYDPFVPPNPDLLNQLNIGITSVDRNPGGLALDYVREQAGGKLMVQQSDMSLLPIPDQNPQDQLKNAVISLLNRASADPEGLIFGFGSGYSDPTGVVGVHNIHMNQGNPLNAGFSNDNGIWQDGALFVRLPATDQWIGLFIAFQSESWQTDDKGDPD